MTIVEPFLAKREDNHLPNISVPEDPDLPEAIWWSCFRVCDWIRNIGYPQYAVKINMIGSF